VQDNRIAIGVSVNLCVTAAYPENVIQRYIGIERDVDVLLVGS